MWANIRVRFGTLKCLPRSLAQASSPRAAATSNSLRLAQRWYSYRSRSIATLMTLSLVQDGDGVALLHGLPFLHLDLPHDAGARRLHGNFHLHRFQHDDGVAGPHRVALLGRDLEHDARDVSLDLLRHEPTLPWEGAPSRGAPLPLLTWFRSLAEGAPVHHLGVGGAAADVGVIERALEERHRALHALHHGAVEGAAQP